MFKKLNLDKNGQACLSHLHHLNLGQNLLFNMVTYWTNPEYVLNNGMPASNYWSLTNIRTLDVSDLYGQMYSVQNNFCKNHEQSVEEYFKKVPDIIERLPNLKNFDVWWDFTKRSYFVKSDQIFNYTNLNPNNGLATAILVSPGTQVLFADSIYAGQTWDFSVLERCPYTVYPPDTVAYFNISRNNAQLLKCPTSGIGSLRGVRRKLRLYENISCGLIQKEIHSKSRNSVR